MEYHQNKMKHMVALVLFVGDFVPKIFCNIIMKDFKYCVWLIPESNTWFSLTNGFIPHMTIKHSMNYVNAKKLYSMYTSNCTKITLHKSHINNIQGFWSYYYDLSFENSVPEWCPENPHISFLYDYKEIHDTIHNHFEKILTQKTATLDTVALVQCIGHFSDWKILCSKKL